MIRDRDALELLLPDADDDAVRHARDVTRFLRLLSTDAEPARACVVGVDIERARAELERADRADLEWALCDLLRHHLSAAASEDSFAWFGEPVLDVRGAWRILGDFELDHEWIASVPAPEEDTRAICERFLDSLERLGVPPARLALWRARASRTRWWVRKRPSLSTARNSSVRPDVSCRRVTHGPRWPASPNVDWNAAPCATRAPCSSTRCRNTAAIRACVSCCRGRDWRWGTRPERALPPRG